MSEMGSWAGLYHWATEKLMLERLTAERDVLQVLANRANPLGFCWPGVGYIAQLCGRADATVENALRRLELMEFICTVRTQNDIRNRVDIDFQVSPFVLFIAPDKLALAMELWERNRNVKIKTVIKESQPTPKNQNQELTPGAQHQNHHHHQTASREVEPPNDSPIQPGKNPKSQNAKTGKNSGKAAKTPAAKPQSQTPSPVPASPSPLDNVADEQIAVRMNAATRYMMSVATARGLVTQYGAAACEAALAHMALQTNVRSPAGYLRSKIERGEIDPVQDAKIPVEEADAKPWLTYVSGKYADYVQSQPAESDIEIEEQKTDE